MAVSTGHFAGFLYAQVMFRNSSGYPMGGDSTPNSVSNGDVKHAYKLTGPVTADIPTPTRNIATFYGGQGILGQLDLGVSDFGTFNLQLSAYDETFTGYITGTTPDVTNVGTSNVLTAPNSTKTNAPQFILALTTYFQTTDGTNRYATLLFPSVTIAPAFPSLTQDAGTNPQALTYVVTPTTSTRSPFGYLNSALSLGLQDNKDIMYVWRTDNPVTFTTYIDDGSSTSFVLGYRPTNSEHAGAVNVITKQGLVNHTNVSAINTSTGVVSNTAGSASDVWVIAYETSFVSI